MHIVNRYPHIKNDFIQSDNAQCYEKGNLGFGLCKIAEEYGLILRAFIHTGVQDGKGCIDAHFATAMKHVFQYCTMSNDVITPIELGSALNANGGISNTISELVGINRRAVERFEEENSAVIEKLQAIGNHMEVQFDVIRKLEFTNLLIYV
jgi:hypothetical protein